MFIIKVIEDLNLFIIIIFQQENILLSEGNKINKCAFEEVIYEAKEKTDTDIFSNVIKVSFYTSMIP